MQSFRQIGSKLWKIGVIQNRYPIVVYGVMSDSESKNPRPMHSIHDCPETERFELPLHLTLRRAIKRAKFGVACNLKSSPKH